VVKRTVQLLGDTKCFYIVNKGSGEALGVSTKDKYAPRKTGIYSIVTEKFDKKDSK